MGLNGNIELPSIGNEELQSETRLTFLREYPGHDPKVIFFQATQNEIFSEFHNEALQLAKAKLGIDTDFMSRCQQKGGTVKMTEYAAYSDNRAVTPWTLASEKVRSIVQFYDWAYGYDKELYNHLYRHHLADTETGAGMAMVSVIFSTDVEFSRKYVCICNEKITETKYEAATENKTEFFFNVTTIWNTFRDTPVEDWTALNRKQLELVANSPNWIFSSSNTKSFIIPK